MINYTTKLIFLCITIIEIIYVYYMLNQFKTVYTVHHPLEYCFNDSLPNYFKHPIGSYEYENKICPFGHFASKILMIYLIIRYFIFIYYNEKNKLRKLNISILILTIIFSLLNMNAFVYLIPYYFSEFYVSYFILNK